MQNHTECRTTDRITGRATSRGYVEGLEQQNRDLQNRIQELEQRMIQGGLDVKPSNGYHPPPVASYDYSTPGSASQAAPWSASGSSYNSHADGALRGDPQDSSLFNALASSRTGCTGDNYLGVSFGNPNLSVKGTALSILGMEIDIADFDSPDMDEPDPSVFHPQLYNKSYQSFLQTVLNINAPAEKADLPPKAEGVTYCEWYFGVINPYFPVLHRPTFFRTVSLGL